MSNRLGLGGGYGRNTSTDSPTRNYTQSPPLRSGGMGTSSSAGGWSSSSPHTSPNSKPTTTHSSYSSSAASPDRYSSAINRHIDSGSAAARMPSPSLSTSYSRQQYSESPSSTYAAGQQSQSPSSLAMRESLSSKAWGNVRFCGIGRTTTKEIVTSHNGYSTISTEMYTEVCQMLIESKSALEIKRQSLTVDEDGKCTCCNKPCDALKQTGAVHFLPASNGWIYIVITGHSYSQRLAYRMLDEIKRTFEDQVDLYSSQDTDRTISRRVMLWLPALCDRYDKLDTSSSMRGLAAQIDRILR